MARASSIAECDRPHGIARRADRGLRTRKRALARTGRGAAARRPCAEHPSTGEWEASLITAPFKTGETTLGTIGVVGPDFRIYLDEEPQMSSVVEIAGQAHLGAGALDRTHGGAQVAGTVVEDDDGGSGHKAPLVEGIPVSRGSSAMASRKARANALNWVSTM